MSKEKIKDNKPVNFADEAKNIGEGATKPDVDALPDVVSVATDPNSGKKKRGRPSKKAAQEQQENAVLYMSSAKSINTVLFMAAHYISGTDEIIPEQPEQKVMDGALATYLAHKEVNVSPEMALFSVYAAWLGKSLQKPEVKKSITKKWSDGLLKKLNPFKKKDKNNESNDN